MKFIISTMILTFMISQLVQSQKIKGMENLGPNVNSPTQYDCFPSISPDGITLFFSRIIEGRDYDIYYSVLGEDNNWSLAKPIEELNNKLKNNVYYVTPDGNTMYLMGNYTAGNISTDGISVTSKTANGWSLPKKISFENENSISWGDQSLSLSSDNQVMIICLKADLWVCYNKGNNLWTEPQKLPANINTSTYEFSPFLAADNTTLYFSGGGHGGLGLNDIFKTTRLDDTWMKWSDPENLGEPVNSSSWESFFAISARGDYAISYSLSSGSGDLFRVDLSEKIKPNPTLLLKGKVVDSKTGLPVQADIVFEDLTTGKKIGQASTNPQTGEYKIILTLGKKYGIYAKAENYFAVNENIDVSDLSQYTELNKDLNIVPVEVGQTVRLNNIFFETGESTLNSDSFAELNRVIAFLNDNLKAKIEISGHTDNIGSDQTNLKLSRDRAEAVKNYLSDNGIVVNRLTFRGYGESKPIESNDTEEGRQINRRVEFTVISLK